MKAKLVTDGAERTFVLVFDSGDEAVAELTAFATRQQLAGGHLTGIGAFQSAVLGFFDWNMKDYRKITIEEQVEVLSLVGDVALKDDKPSVHAHVVLGKADGTAHGGHLLSAHVRPTLEVVLVESPARLRRIYDAATRLALIDLNA
jgi:predicted DNA-binding protein with PD1-like motif